MIYNDIKNFYKQFEYEPKVENKKGLALPARRSRGGGGSRVEGFVVVGVGGSHLGADILKSLRPELDITVWSNYGLPPIPRNALKKKLVIASSYSGNTEEAIDAFFEAKKRGLQVAVVAAGGKLIALAKKYKVPYIEMPDWGAQPRMATGVSLRALLKLMGDETTLRATSELARTLKPAALEGAGKKLARKLKGRVPVIYASLRNFSSAYIWKIKFNENCKIPAFCNFFSELNHNEMTGFDVKQKTRALSNKFNFIFLKDADDDRRIQKRMRILERLYKDRGLLVEAVNLIGNNRLHKIFSSIVLADWTSYYTAKMYGVEPEQIPMVEDFKKRMAA